MSKQRVPTIPQNYAIWYDFVSQGNEALADELQSHRLLSKGALFIAEHRHGTALAERYGSLVMTTVRRYGDTSITVYETAA